MGIVWSLCDLTPQTYFKSLLQKSLKIIRRKAEHINFADLETTLTKLTLRTNYYQPYYYNEEFFDTVGDLVIKKNLGFQQALWVQQKFNKVVSNIINILNILNKYPKLILGTFSQRTY